MKSTLYYPIIATAVLTGCRSNKQAQSTANIDSSLDMQSLLSVTCLSNDTLLSRLNFEAHDVEITKDSSGLCLMKIPLLTGQIRQNHISRQKCEVVRHDTIAARQTAEINTLQTQSSEPVATTYGWISRIILLLAIIFAVGYYVKKQNVRQAA